MWLFGIDGVVWAGELRCGRGNAGQDGEERDESLQSHSPCDVGDCLQRSLAGGTRSTLVLHVSSVVGDRHDYAEDWVPWWSIGRMLHEGIDWGISQMPRAPIISPSFGFRII